MTDETKPKISARARVDTDALTGKPILLYPEGVLILNPTGHAIVSLCSGDASVGEIVDSLAKRYQVEPAKIEPEVMQYLSRLQAKNLLETSS